MTARRAVRLPLAKDTRRCACASWSRRRGTRARAYSVYVDPSDNFWLTDIPANAILRFDPATEAFLSFPSDKPGANVRQMDGVAGQAWGGESGTDCIVGIEYGP